MARTKVGTFLKQVRQEVSKVTWPTRAETFASALLVIIVALLMGLFFFMVDQILAWAVKFIFGLGG